MTTTAIVLIVSVILLLLYDLFAVIKWGGDFTISWQIWTFSKLYPIIPFLMGVVIGHMLWVQNCS